MKKRKNVLIVTSVFYILAAVCAVVVFLIRPIGMAEHKQEDNGHTKGDVWAAADVKPTETMMADADSGLALDASVKPTTVSQNVTVMQPSADVEPTSDVQPAISGQSGTKAPQPTAQIQPRTESPTAAPDSPLLAGEYDVLYSAVSMKGSVNMRRAPDNSGAVAFSIPQGGICEVLLENVNGWTLVEYRGYMGFVYGSFLEPI